MILKTTTSYPIPHQTGKGKSRRDGTLLTVGFNLRKRSNVWAMKSPEGTIFTYPKSVVPAGLCVECVARPVRRLKSTVNKVPSLRDKSLLIRYFYKFFFFYSSIKKP